jgi:molybdopterin/thiamine biosynthesis adenylyltransferase
LIINTLFHTFIQFLTPPPQVAKNIILAGVGSVTLVDDTPSSAAAPGNFLVSHDAKDKTVAEACVATLQEMNPLVSVNAVAGTPSTFVTAATVSGYNIVILVGQSGAVVDAADVACRETNVPLIAACSRGLAGWAFANMHTHKYIIENKTEQSDGTSKTITEEKSMEGVSWETAVGAAVEKRQMRRMSPFLPILRGKREKKK